MGRDGLKMKKQDMSFGFVNFYRSTWLPSREIKEVDTSEVFLWRSPIWRYKYWSCQCMDNIEPWNMMDAQRKKMKTKNPQNFHLKWTGRWGGASKGVPKESAKEVEQLRENEVQGSQEEIVLVHEPRSAFIMKLNMQKTVWQLKIYFVFIHKMMTTNTEILS